MEEYQKKCWERLTPFTELQIYRSRPDFFLVEAVMGSYDDEQSPETPIVYDKTKKVLLFNSSDPEFLEEKSILVVKSELENVSDVELCGFWLWNAEKSCFERQFESQDMSYKYFGYHNGPREVDHLLVCIKPNSVVGRDVIEFEETDDTIENIDNFFYWTQKIKDLYTTFLKDWKRT